MLIVLQVYDLDDVENGEEDTGDPDYQAGGRRRTLVIGRADYCPENRPNIQYAVEKLRLFETLRSLSHPYHILGDCKVINDLIGTHNDINLIEG